MMHSYDPADDEPDVYEPDTEYYRPDPDPDDEMDWEAYDAWMATLPRQTVTHACGHAHSYAVADGLPPQRAEEPCWDCRVDDDPFREEQEVSDVGQ